MPSYDVASNVRQAPYREQVEAFVLIRRWSVREACGSGLVTRRRRRRRRRHEALQAIGERREGRRHRPRVGGVSAEWSECGLGPREGDGVASAPSEKYARGIYAFYVDSINITTRTTVVHVFDFQEIPTNQISVNLSRPITEGLQRLGRSGGAGRPAT